MMYIKINKVLTFKGEDAKSFLDSLISNEFIEEEIVPSFLLFPNGKINFWFLVELNGNSVNLYQDNKELENIKKTFEKYKIRINCDININDANICIKINPENFKVIHEDNDNKKDFTSWNEIALKTELPTLESISNGLLPNETKWLLTFLNFEKGCFLGQEPVSRVNFRGIPRRKLITNEDGLQEFIKI